MKKIILLLLIFVFWGCSGTNTLQSNQQNEAQKINQFEFDQELQVRITVYWRYGSGTDKWTSQGLTATGQRAKDRKTAAVDPKIIPFYSEIKIPELNKELIAHDTGRDVKSRRASDRTGRNEPIIDIFFNKKEDALRFANNNPKIVTAYIIKPERPNKDGG